MTLCEIFLPGPEGRLAQMMRLMLSMIPRSGSVDDLKEMRRHAVATSSCEELLFLKRLPHAPAGCFDSRVGCLSRCCEQSQWHSQMLQQDFHKKNEKLFDEHSLNFQVDHDAVLDSADFRSCPLQIVVWQHARTRAGWMNDTCRSPGGDVQN